MSGGAPVTLARVEDYGRGASWGRDGTIVFSPGFVTGLSVVSASGGPERVLTTADRAKQETSHRFPHQLPSGDVLFTVGTGGSWDEARVELLKPTGTDGRFLMVKENEQVAAAKAVNVVLGWLDELEAKMPR